MVNRPQFEGVFRSYQIGLVLVQKFMQDLAVLSASTLFSNIWHREEIQAKLQAINVTGRVLEHQFYLVLGLAKAFQNQNAKQKESFHYCSIL